jgi:hypothetical protein
MRTHEDKCPVPATNSAPKPADFPLGSLESRAAARTMAKTRAEGSTREPIMYIAHFDSDQEVYPLYPEPQPSESGTAVIPLPNPSESMSSPPSWPNTPPVVITVEVG